MNNSETFEIHMRLDFGAVGTQSVSVIGTARECSKSVTEVETEIRSVTVYLLAKDLSHTEWFVITHLIDSTAKTDIHERIERRYLEWKRVRDAHPAYDFDGPGAA